MKKEKKMIMAFIGLCLGLLFGFPVSARTLPKMTTPEYKVAYYQFENYHLLDEDGRRSGYGYEMMQQIANHIQCTFSYEGYENSAKECEKLLKEGKLDIYTAAKKTPEREKIYVFSKHPAITASTCLNCKLGNQKFVAGDFDTYQGMQIGLLENHSYNDTFLSYLQEKNIECEITFYKTEYELNKALINNEVEAILDSYIRMSEDQYTLEYFGDTPYYFMARKEDWQIIDQIDQAIDEMNVETPRWRADLYNKYYGAEVKTPQLNEQELLFLQELKDNQVLIRAVMNPDNEPYSWIENGTPTGIVADIFKETARQLGISYEIVPTATREEYKKEIDTEAADIWIDKGSLDKEKYKSTNSYLTTTISILRLRSESGKIKKIGMVGDDIEFLTIMKAGWPDAEKIVYQNNEEAVTDLANHNVDGILMLSFTAQKITFDDIQNRFRAEIVPESKYGFYMGVNAELDHRFISIWEKTLTRVAEEYSNRYVQEYLEQEEKLEFLAFLYDHPEFSLILVTIFFLLILILLICIHLAKKRKLQKIESEQLTVALKEASEANIHLEEQYKLVETISRDTEDVFIINTEEMTSTPIKIGGIILPEEKRKVRAYENAWEYYITSHVETSEWDYVRECVKIENVLNQLEHSMEYAIRYRLRSEERIDNCQVKFLRLGEKDSCYIVLGIRCIDEIIRTEQAQQDILKEARNVAEKRLKEIEELNAKLETALQQAEAANKAKSTFLFNMSHDIRTPMNAIVGYTELILNHENDSEKCKDYLRKIQSSSEFLLELINNVLEMARIESNETRLEEVPIFASEIIDEVIAVYSELLKKKKITFIQEKDIQAEWIYADKVKIKQIFLNLVSNAYKYTLEGGTIYIGRKQLPCEEEGFVVVKTIISDTGIGMSKEYLPRLFDEFSRERNVTENKIQGTGLGMPIVKRLVDLMGGTITVESELGKGTTFEITLKHRIAEPVEITQNNKIEADNALFQGKRILLAEDNDLNAEIATVILEDAGFLVERAADGIICVDMLQKAPKDYYQLILMDIQMPNMNGYKATRTIRELPDEEKSHIIIIAMTANAFEEDKRDAFEAGMNGHLSKPIHVKQLFELIQNEFRSANSHSI